MELLNLLTKITIEKYRIIPIAVGIAWYTINFILPVLQQFLIRYFRIWFCACYYFGMTSADMIKKSLKSFINLLFEETQKKLNPLLQKLSNGFADVPFADLITITLMIQPLIGTNKSPVN